MVREMTLIQKPRESEGLGSTKIWGEGTPGRGKSRAVLAGVGTPSRQQRPRSQEPQFPDSGDLTRVPSGAGGTKR